MSHLWLYAIVFVVSALRIYARAGQQLNVVDYRWLRVPVFSYVMAAGDFALWGSAYVFFERGRWIGWACAVLVYGTAGWIGAILAMWLHRRCQ